MDAYAAAQSSTVVCTVLSQVSIWVSLALNGPLISQSRISSSAFTVCPARSVKPLATWVPAKLIMAMTTTSTPITTTCGGR